MANGEDYAKERAKEFAEAREAFLLGVAADPGLQTSDVKVALVLAVGYVNKAQFDASGEMWAWPGIETLKKKTAVSDRTVMRSLVRLQRMGWITLVAPQRGPGRHNRYRLERPNLTSLCQVLEAPSDNTSEESGKSENLTSRVPNTCHLGAEKPDTVVSPDSLEENPEQQPSNAPPAGTPTAPAADAQEGSGRQSFLSQDFDQHKRLEIEVRIEAAMSAGVHRHVQRLIDEMGATQHEAWHITFKMLDGDGPKDAWRSADQFLHYESVARN